MNELRFFCVPMKLRIIQRPDGYVELQQRRWFKWHYIQSWGNPKEEAWARARTYARAMLTPLTEYL